MPHEILQPPEVVSLVAKGNSQRCAAAYVATPGRALRARRLAVEYRASSCCASPRLRACFRFSIGPQPYRFRHAQGMAVRDAQQRVVANALASGLRRFEEPFHLRRIEVVLRSIVGVGSITLSVSPFGRLQKHPQRYR